MHYLASCSFMGGSAPPIFTTGATPMRYSHLVYSPCKPKLSKIIGGKRAAGDPTTSAAGGPPTSDPASQGGGKDMKCGSKGNGGGSKDFSLVTFSLSLSWRPGEQQSQQAGTSTRCRPFGCFRWLMTAFLFGVVLSGRAR